MFSHISLEDFERRTGIKVDGLTPAWDSSARIVSLRDIKEIASVQAMPLPYLSRLIGNIGLEGDVATKPYAGLAIKRLRMDPNGLHVAQTFIERRKYRALLEDFPNVFEGFCVTRGIAKLTASIVIGKLTDGSVGIAHYLPPIIEENGGVMCLLDGTHRNYLMRAAGTTIESVVILGVSTPFPCEPQRWAMVRAMDEKPPRDQRFVNLRTDLFRDVKSIGIDG